MPGLLAAQTHHQVGHIALTSVMKGEGQPAGFTGTTTARRAGDSGRCDNRRRCRCHRRGGSGPELERAGRRSGAFTERLAVRRGLMREARQRAREPTADGQRGSIFDRCRQRNASNQKQLQYLIANDARSAISRWMPSCWLTGKRR